MNCKLKERKLIIIREYLSLGRKLIIINIDPWDPWGPGVLGAQGINV